MKKLRSIIRYFCAKYPHSQELSNARLTKMVYLADWESAKKNQKQMTGIDWYFNNYGPFVDDVREASLEDTKINVISTTNMYGMRKTQMEFKGESGEWDLDVAEISILDSVINVTAPKYWNDFIRYVYSTYPIKNNPRYSSLDLVLLSQEETAQ